MIVIKNKEGTFKLNGKTVDDRISIVRELALGFVGVSEVTKIGHEELKEMIDIMIAEEKIITIRHGEEG